MQECEISCFDTKGSDNLNIIDLKKNSDASYIKHILSNSPDHRLLISRLKKRNIDFYNTTSYNFFSNKSYAGETKDLTVYFYNLLTRSLR